LRKDEFLTELRNGLDGRVSPAELEDILNDYRELFAEGLLEGKTEEALCAELGSPAQTVKLILAERSSNGHVVVEREEEPPYAPLYKRIAAALLDFILSVLPLAFFGNVINVIPIMMIWPPAPFLYAVDPPPSTGTGPWSASVIMCSIIVCFCSCSRDKLPANDGCDCAS